ncbi:transketolase C-terminal domain-containing protein [Streptomyces sp. NPDC059083]|uniref:transketolase C-terminal domain-containing protein n=1 Tax=Streptomyces sp. NPDC059083 TaxID=3346721 RepID=UPI0036B66E10
MVKTCLEAAAAAAEEGKSVEVVDLRSISPIRPVAAAWAAPMEGLPVPIRPRPAYCSSLARESAMSRLRMVSWPIRSTGPKAESSVRSMDSLSGW